MLAVITCQTGRIFHAAGQSDLQQTRPSYSFVPDEFLSESGFRKDLYLASRWPSINAGANPYAIGSHVIPDIAQPVSSHSQCLILAEFLRRLAIIASIKSIKHP